MQIFKFESKTDANDVYSKLSAENCHCLVKCKCLNGKINSPEKLIDLSMLELGLNTGKYGPGKLRKLFTQSISLIVFVAGLVFQCGMGVV